MPALAAHMIHGLDGPVVVLPARAAAILARPLERLVADARRRGETVEECVLEALGDCERVRRALVAQASSANGTAEPDFPVQAAGCGRDPDLSTQDVAGLLGYSPSYVRRLGRERRLGVKVAGVWRFPVADVVALREQRTRALR